MQKENRSMEYSPEHIKNLRSNSVKKLKKDSKSSGNRLNALQLILILKNYSSPEHPISISTILEKFDKHFNDSDTPTSTSTISRLLTALCEDKILRYNTEERGAFYKDAFNSGFDIRCVIKNPNTDAAAEDRWIDYVPGTYVKSPTLYYYYDAVITDAELTLLIDAIETCNYFSGEDIVEICTKLRNLRPLSSRSGSYTSDKADNDSLLIQNIDELQKIIKERSFANITYCNNDYQQNLVPHPGYPRIIRPLKMLWSNGYYYLVCLYPKRETADDCIPINLRIDRLTDIEKVDATPELEAAYPVSYELQRSLADTVSYRLQHPVMHAGSTTEIQMLYLDSQNGLMNNLIRDTFGKPERIKLAAADTLKQHLPDGILEEALKTQAAKDPGSDKWIHITLKTATGGAELFAMQHCNYCKIIAPLALADKISNNLSAGLSLYQRKP